ncbi:MAG: glycoside hydrolase family 97 catalytic domain-containing protein, partial [Sediminibacterium sp.]
MKKVFFIFLFFIACLGSLFARSGDAVVSQSSPDNGLVLTFRVNNQSIEYRVAWKKEEILSWSPLGLSTNTKDIVEGKMEITKTTLSTYNGTFAWQFGENNLIQDNFKQIAIECKQGNGFVFHIIARVYNNTIAFLYKLPLPPNGLAYTIVNEKTGFNFNRSYAVYRHTSESVISPTPMNELKANSDFPVVLTSPGLFISINEASNDRYTKAVVGKADGDNHLVVRFNNDSVKVDGVFASPWRTISFSKTAIGLCDNSDLLYKLCWNPNPSIDYSWIKPGKLIRDVTLTTKGALACIDFAAKMDFQYVMFDAGWYGKGYAAEHDQSSDPHNVVAEIDMARVIDYGKEKNIGLILYVNYVGLRKHNLDTLFSLYKKWGVKGLKFGFVNGLTQDGISWLIKAVRKAQDYGFVINVHDNYKPTGLSRAIPAFLTQEGVRGNENNPDAVHNTTLPFTRFLSGAADYTFCFPNQNDSFNTTILSKKLQVSKAQQLALSVVFFSPLQSMLWYGKPADYTLPEEIEFFKYVP